MRYVLLTARKLHRPLSAAPDPHVPTHPRTQETELSQTPNTSSNTTSNPILTDAAEGA